METGEVMAAAAAALAKGTGTLMVIAMASGTGKAEGGGPWRRRRLRRHESSQGMGKCTVISPMMGMIATTATRTGMRTAMSATTEMGMRREGAEGRRIA